jgi:hypothetical protein
MVDHDDRLPHFGIDDRPEPDPQRHDWIEFLRWGVANEGWGTEELLFVIEKPWKSAAEYGEFLERNQ